MKNRRLSVILVLLTMLSIYQVGCNGDPPPPKHTPKHIGGWVDPNLREAIIFHQNGTFELLYYYHPDPVRQPGQPAPPIPDDKTWKVKARGQYIIDFSKNPAWIDLVAEVQGTPRRTQGLIKFLDNNTFYAAFDNVRPASIESFSRKARFTRAAPGEIGPISK